MAERDSVYNYDTAAKPVERPESLPDRRPRAKRPQITMTKTEAKSGSVFTIIIISALAVALFGSVIYSLNKRNTMYSRVSSLQSELNLAEAENARLQSELQAQVSAKNVEEYAENVLGMQKIDSSQIKYIKIHTDDIVNIPEQEPGFIERIKIFVRDCVEYFRG